MNFFISGRINDIVRLTLIETGHRLKVHSIPIHPAAALPGASNEAKRLVGRVRASPGSAGKFNVTMEIWANPSGSTFADAPPKPLLAVTARDATFSQQLGVTFQKKAASKPTVTRLDDLRFGRTAKDVLD